MPGGKESHGQYLVRLSICMQCTFFSLLKKNTATCVYVYLHILPNKAKINVPSSK